MTSVEQMSYNDKIFLLGKKPFESSLWPILSKVEEADIQGLITQMKFCS